MLMKAEDLLFILQHTTGVSLVLQLLCYGARIDDEFYFDEDDTDSTRADQR